jgi:hypothetical protein
VIIISAKYGFLLCKNEKFLQKVSHPFSLSREACSLFLYPRFVSAGSADGKDLCAVFVKISFWLALPSPGEVLMTVYSAS